MRGDGLSGTSSQYALLVTDKNQQTAEALLEAADRVVISQQGIAQEVDAFRRDFKANLGKVESSIDILTASFDWAFAELIWLLEQQQGTLQRILEVLQAPLDTQAKELRKRAERAYAKGWIDEALEDFKESEKKNTYDFTVHFYLGNIYYFHKQDLPSALSCYHKAAKFASPESPQHAAFSLLHVGAVEYQRGEFLQAYTATREAIELYPTLPESHYQHARYCARVGKNEEAYDHLRRALCADKLYCAKASVEKDFASIRAVVASYLQNICAEIHGRAKAQLHSTGELLQKIGPHIAKLKSFHLSYPGPNWSGKVPQMSKLKKELDGLTGLLERNTIFESWNALVRARGIVDDLYQNCTELADCVSSDLCDYHQPRLERIIAQRYGWALGLLGGCFGVFPYLRILAVMQRANLDTGAITFWSVPLLLVFGGVIGRVFFFIGDLVGRRFVFPRSWARQFQPQETVLFRLEGALQAAKKASPADSWWNVISSIT